MYTYKRLLSEVSHLGRAGIKTGSIGKSVDGRIIPYIFAGNPCAPCIVITGGIHAREHIGSYCVMQQVYYALNRLHCFQAFGGIYFIPMLNPDGNVIAACGAAAICCPFRRELVSRILNGGDARLYKANANGVDLNVNFDANWGTGKQNIRYAATENYIGPAPFSEPETQALRDFTLQHQPLATVSYHAIGRELYWEFGQIGARRSRDLAVAEYVNERLAYALKGDDGTSAGGYKDYCVQKLGITAITVELVDDRYPHPFLHYACAEEDIKRNLDLPERLLCRVTDDGHQTLDFG